MDNVQSATIPTPSNPDALACACVELRTDIKKLAIRVKELKSLPMPPFKDNGETMANIMLSYRHIEDARMRLGKVLEVLNGEGEFVKSII